MEINKGVNQEDIQRINRTLLLQLMQKEGECSRVHLSRITGLKQATITNIINDFIKWRLVVETGFLNGKKGRRSIGIALNRNAYGVLGLRLSRRSISIALFDLSGSLLYKKRVALKKGNGPVKSMGIMADLVQEVLSKTTDRKVLAIGIAIPGPYLVRERRIIIMTEEEPGWEKIFIDKELEEKFHIPVFLEHDADAAAYCQMRYNNCIDSEKPLAYIAVGQGIGAGIIVNGQVYKGELGTAGELGHLSIDMNGPKCKCGNRGCLERYASSTAFTYAVNKRLQAKAPLSFEEVKHLTQEGNQICLEEYKKACDMLAVGLASFIYILNPGTIILGDDMTHVCPELLMESIHTVLKRRLLTELYEGVDIQLSKIENSMLHGAGIIAIGKIFNDPERFLSEE